MIKERINKGIFKVKDNLTKAEIILKLIRESEHGITTLQIAKTCKISYLTARRWAEYLRMNHMGVSRTTIGHSNVYYYNKNSYTHIRKVIENGSTTTRKSSKNQEID